MNILRRSKLATQFIVFTTTVLFCQTLAATEVPQVDGTLTSGADFVAGDIYVDSGGSAFNYSDNESSVIRFCAVPDESVTITFTSFELEYDTSCWDELTVTGDVNSANNDTYSGEARDSSGARNCTDGTDQSGAPILPVFESAPGACLTFSFESNEARPRKGWQATIGLLNTPVPPAVNIPTLSEWGVMFLVGGLFGVTLLQRRCRN